MWTKTRFKSSRHTINQLFRYQGHQLPGPLDKVLPLESVMSFRYFEGAEHAADYAKFRPSPPPLLGDRIIDFLREKHEGPLDVCLDVGCGTGQCTSLFAPKCRQVIGYDVSPAQIREAQKLNYPQNVQFLVSPAESLLVDSGSVQIVNSSQACHWFDLPNFFREVDRVLCPNGIVALSGYSIPYVVHPDKSEQLRQQLNDFYDVHTFGYWSDNVSHLDNEYANIHIPYKEVVREEVWTDDKLISLSLVAADLSTGSGFQELCRQKGGEAGRQVLNKFIHNCKDILETDEPADKIYLTLKRKYFLTMGRKPILQ